VKRYWAHSPTPEIAAWAARAEISAAVGREKKHPDLLLFRDPLAPDASLGWKTTVHEFTDVKGVVAPHFQTSAMLDGFRMAMMAAISGAERSGKRPVDYFVAEALAASKNDAAALYSRVAHRPAARSLRRSGATPYGIAREIALERACDEFARMLRCDEHCAEEHQAFFTAIHSNLMRPVGANLVDVGPAEEADSEDLASCLGSDTLVAALDHAEARGDEEEFDLGGHSADSDRGDDLDRGSHHFDGDSQCDFGGSGQDDSGDEDDDSDDDSDDGSDDGGGWNDDDSGF
jgi:hypothetical protein